MEAIYERLKEFIEEGRWEEVEPFLTGCMDRARKEEAHGIYLACGNELLEFYRQTGQFGQAFAAAEDLLVLMEELQLEETGHFALVLGNAAAAYEGAGRFREAVSYYERAVRTLEGVLKAQRPGEDGEKQELEELLAETLTRYAMALSGCQEEGNGDGAWNKKETLFGRAVSLYEQNEERERNAQTQRRFELYYLTGLSGLGEAAWRKGEEEHALHYYERAAERSECYSGPGEGTKLLWENCEKLSLALHEEEKARKYRRLCGGLC